MLEELGVEYKLKLYKRDAGNRADKALKDVFPTGKSPVVEVDYQNGKPPVIVAESGHIVNYLVKHFSKDGVLQPVDDEGEDELDYLIQFTEASLQPFLTMVLVLETAVHKAPYLMRPVVTKFSHAIRDTYSLPEVNIAFSILESKLAENAKTAAEGSLFFVQNKISGADIMLHFAVQILYNSSRFEDFDGSKYPLVEKWLKQVEERPAYKKAVARAETEGQGKFKIAFGKI